jgi:hypothetical protein
VVAGFYLLSFFTETTTLEAKEHVLQEV